MAKADTRDCEGASAAVADEDKHDPCDSLLSERSELFYNGTYRWNGTDGFWDDTGSELCELESTCKRVFRNSTNESSLP